MTRSLSLPNLRRPDAKAFMLVKSEGAAYCVPQEFCVDTTLVNASISLKAFTIWGMNDPRNQQRRRQESSDRHRLNATEL